MSEIININIGQASVRIGHQFWNRLTQEHCMHQKQKQGQMTFFQQNNQAWESRSIFIDTDQREIDKLRIKPGTLYNQKDLISKDIPSYGIYSKSAYFVYNQIDEMIQQRIRKKIQFCDNFTGFVLFYSYGGGTSSGVGSKLLDQIRSTYCSKIIQTVRLLPDKLTGNPLQIYNTVLGFNTQVCNSDFSLFFRNDAAQKTMFREGQQQSIKNTNKWIASAISETTIPYRFAGSLNTSQRKIATNLVLFPRMKFSAFTLCNKFNINPVLSAIDPLNLSVRNYLNSDRSILCSYIGVRDHFCSEELIITTADKNYEKRNFRYVQWMPDKIHVGINDPISRPSASMMINSHHFAQLIKDIAQRFSSTFRRKAYVYNYTDSGMDEMQFIQAESNLNDLQSQYHQNIGMSQDYYQETDFQDI